MTAVLVLRRESRACERLRDYLDDHPDLKKGITVVLFRDSELNEKIVEGLKERGFERFPTMVTGDGSKTIGYEAIVERLNAAHELATAVKKMI